MQSWIEGETLPRTFTLLLNGSVMNLTGCTVELQLRDSEGMLVDVSGDVTVPTPSNGGVIYAPDATDLVAGLSPYSALFKVTNALAQVGYFPSTGADLWLVGDGLTGMTVLTFLDLRRQVLRWLDALEDLDTGNVLDELVKQQLNDAQMARVSEYPWPWLRTTTTVALTGGQTSYSLPGNVGRLLYAVGADGRPATRIPDRMLLDAGIGLDGQTRSRLYLPFTIVGSRLTLLESPTASTTLHLGYYRVPQPLVNDQDLPDLPFPHGRLLMWDALLDLKTYAKDIEAASIWMKKQDEALRNLYQAFVDGQTLGEMPQFVHPEWRG